MYIRLDVYVSLVFYRFVSIAVIFAVHSARSAPFFILVWFVSLHFGRAENLCSGCNQIVNYMNLNVRECAGMVRIFKVRFTNNYEHLAGHIDILVERIDSCSA